MALNLYSAASTDALLATKLSDAPSDGSTYGRKDGAWEVVSGGGGSYLPLAGGTMDADATVQLSDVNYDSQLAGWGFGVELTSSPSENASIGFNYVKVQNSLGSTEMRADGITFPDFTTQSTAAVSFTGGTLSSIVAVAGSGGTSSLGTDSGGSISVTDLSATTTTKVTYSGITFSDSSTMTTAPVSGANLGDAFTLGKVQDVSASSGYWQITFAPVNAQAMASGLSVSLSDGSSSESITSYSTTSTWTYTTSTLTNADYIYITYQGQRSIIPISNP
jgi:hypothetical protein